MQLSQALEGKCTCTFSSHPIGYDYRTRFGRCLILKRIYGGTLFFANNDEGFAIIADESFLAARLAARDMPEPISIYLFATEQDRMMHALRRGWWMEQMALR